MIARQIALVIGPSALCFLGGPGLCQRANHYQPSRPATSKNGSCAGGGKGIRPIASGYTLVDTRCSQGKVHVQIKVRSS